MTNTSKRCCSDVMGGSPMNIDSAKLHNINAKKGTMISGNTWKLREKERKVYTDEGIDDDEIDGKRNFDVLEKLASDKYNADFVKLMKGQDVNVKYFQENGFKYPMVVKDKEGLGLRIPSKNFTVEEVKKCVGSRRMIDVLDVTTQKALEMTMKEWVKYYTNTEDRDRLLNVLSLECSHSRLENYVEQPEVVKQIDWVDTVWPRYLKDMQTETTNVLDKMCYPKVQRYCLMSVKGCYTDFHIDMGGTSVWYHILHGAKVFWLVPPTEKNLALYEDWVLSGKQGDEFFPDKVEKAQKIVLKPGWTFFIPTGWIHGVYTPEDSLVFGGNFVHSFNISMQLRIWETENRTHVPMKFRYPFFTEIHWYVLERYVNTLTGKSHRKKNLQELKEEQDSGVKSEPMSPASSVVMDTEDERSCDSQPQSPIGIEQKGVNGQMKSTKKISDQSKMLKNVSVNLQKHLTNGNSGHFPIGHLNGDSKPKVHLTKYELEGLRKIIAFLENLAVTKKYVPKDILDPDGLIADSKLLVFDHEADNPEFANTGEFTLKWAPRKNDRKMKTYTSHFQMKKTVRRKGHRPRDHRSPSMPVSKKQRRRVRCKVCEPCTRDECRICHFCKDMKKFGGAGVMKQCCLSRQCIAPMLPKSTECLLCHKLELTEPGVEEFQASLMECGFCFNITHPYCFTVNNPQLTCEGVENEDLPNSWECPRCVTDGKQGQGWKKEYPKAPGCKRLEVGRKSPSEYDVASPLSLKVYKSESRSSVSPTGSSSLSTCSSFSVSPDGKIYGNVDGLKELSVKIERLRDIDTLPTASVTDTGKRVIESPKLEIIKKKTSSQSEASTRDSPMVKKEIVIETACDPLEIKNTEYSFKAEPVKRKAENSASSVEKCQSAAGGGKRRREGRRTRSSSVQSDSSQQSQEEKSATGRQTPSTADRKPLPKHAPAEQQCNISNYLTPHHSNHQPTAPKRHNFTHVKYDPILTRIENETTASQGNISTAIPGINTDNDSGNGCPAPKLCEEEVVQENEAKDSQRCKISPNTEESEGMDSSQGQGCNSTKKSGNNEVKDSRQGQGCKSTAKNGNSQDVPVRRSRRRNRAEDTKEGKTSDDETPKKRVKRQASMTHDSPIGNTPGDRIRSSSNEDSPVDGHKPKQAGSGSGQGQKSGQKSSSGSQDSSRNQGSTGSYNGGSSAFNGGSASGGGGGSMGGGGDGGGRRGGDWKKREPQTGSGGGKIPDLKPCKVLVQKYVIRPAPVPPPPKTVELKDGKHHPLHQDVWKVIFIKLAPHDLAQCLRVCKTWYRWVMDHTLWQSIDLTNTRVTKQHLIGLVKRQPMALNLDYTNASFRQLEWLVARLPCLRNLSMVGNAWPAVSALCSSVCPMLHSLDLSWVTGVHDNCLKDLLSPPLDHRPGIVDIMSRFHNCTQLNLTGSDITDAAVVIVQANLPKIEKLNLSCCTKITDEAIRTVSNMTTLREFDVSKCRNLTSQSLSFMRNLPHLKMLCILGCLTIEESSIADFTQQSRGQYYKRPGLVILP